MAKRKGVITSLINNNDDHDLRRIQNDLCARTRTKSCRVHQRDPKDDAALSVETAGTFLNVYK